MQLVWLLHIATRCLITVGEAALLVWAIALAVVLAAWLAWCGTWILRRLGITAAIAKAAFQARAGPTSRDRAAYQTRAER